MELLRRTREKTLIIVRKVCIIGKPCIDCATLELDEEKESLTGSG